MLVYAFLSFGIIGLILCKFENSSAEAGASRRRQCCIITLLLMNRLNKTESAIFASLICFLLPGDLHSELIYLKQSHQCSSSKASIHGADTCVFDLYS